LIAMARIFPDRFPHGDDPKKRAEGDTFRALQRDLDDTWMVFYEVRWQSKRFRKQGDGEADFVLAHRKHGVIVLEVKGGKEIRQENGQWLQTSHNGNVHSTTSPFEQGELAKHALKKYLSEHVTGFRENSRIGHAAAFPGFRLAHDLGLDAPRKIIVDKDDLANMAGSIERVAGHWSPLESFDDRQFKELKQALAPTRSIQRSRADDAEDIRKELIELTNRQYQLIRLLSGRRRRALVEGGAGTGKTLIAVQRAKELAADGFRVLLVCFNRPLGDHLADQFKTDLEAKGNNRPGEVLAGGFHSICHRLAETAGTLPLRTSDQRWWDETLPSALLAASDKIRKFDALIIDEGQDFPIEWFDILQLLLKDPGNGFLYVFADANQDIYRNGWQSPIADAPHLLFQNCRNTLQIAEKVNLALDTEEQPLAFKEGPNPTWHVASTQRQIEKRLTSVLDSLLNKEGFTPEQVVVLSSSRVVVDELAGLELAGWHLGESSSTDQVMIDTVHRFKGLERDAVVLLLPELANQEDRNLAYVGLSRPIAVLHVIGPEEARDQLGWSP